MGQTRPKKSKKGSKITTQITEILEPKIDDLKLDDAPSSTQASSPSEPHRVNPQVASEDDTIESDSEPDPDQFPIEVRPTPNKGMGVFATRKIPAGALILQEPPLIRLSRSDEATDSLSALFSTLTKPQQKTYLSLHDSQKSSFSQIKSIYYSNCYNLSHPWHSAGGGSCLGALSSRVNHACVPNAQFSFDPTHNLMVFRALRPIARGREVVSNYDTGFEARATRHRRQTMYYGFVCGCEACEVPSRSGFWARSDGRREAMAEVAGEVGECERRWGRGGGEGDDPREALERLVALLVKEGLVGLPLADAYGNLARWAARKGDGDAVGKWKRKELEVCELCFGRRSVKARELRTKLNEEDGNFK